MLSRDSFGVSDAINLPGGEDGCNKMLGGGGQRLMKKESLLKWRKVELGCFDGVWRAEFKNFVYHTNGTLEYFF